MKNLLSVSIVFYDDLWLLLPGVVATVCNGPIVVGRMKMTREHEKDMYLNVITFIPNYM